MAEHRPSHRDPGHVAVIGGTNATARGWRDRAWARYYHRAYTTTVASLLAGVPRGAVLDLGTSHGHWYPFLESAGFAQVVGIELDHGRARQAADAGYIGVANADGTNIPFAANSFDAVLSSDVLVHILGMREKAAVFAEVARVLRPGGAFIVNHAMARAFLHQGPHIDSYCSFLDLDSFIRLGVETAGFQLADVRPTYFRFRTPGGRSPRYIARALAVLLPGGDGLLRADDARTRREAPLDTSDAVYLKLVKSG